MIDEYTLHLLKEEIWRNMPAYPAYPSTFSECSNRCGRGYGRGGGICLTCAQENLAKVVGPVKAQNFVTAIVALRQSEKELLDSVMGF